MAQDPPSGPTRFQSVQVLRALAALAVVAFHSIEANQPHAGSWAVGLQSGVDVFFVVSGFVMVVATERRSVSGAEFFAGRMRRIIPLFWLSMFATCLAISAGIVDRTPPDVIDVLKTAAFVFYTDPFSGQPLPFVGQAWTLNYEVLFYVYYAATLRLMPGRQTIVIMVIVLAMSSFRLFADQADAFATRMTSPLPLEFVAGMLIARYRSRIPALPGVVAVIMVAASALCLLIYLPGPRTFAVGIPAATLIVSVLRFEPVLACSRYAYLHALGDASYAIYLFHSLAIAVAGIISSSATIAFSAAVICGLIAHRYIEKPLDLALCGLRDLINHHAINSLGSVSRFQHR